MLSPCLRRILHGGLAYDTRTLSDRSENKCQRCVVQVSAARKAPRMKCCLCRQQYGAHIQCCFSRCYTAFHAMCGRLEGWPLQTVDVNAPLNEDLKARLLNQKGFREGVSCDNGLRLLSYCHKHMSCAEDYTALCKTPQKAVSLPDDTPGVAKLQLCMHDVCCGCLRFT